MHDWRGIVMAVVLFTACSAGAGSDEELSVTNANEVVREIRFKAAHEFGGGSATLYQLSFGTHPAYFKRLGEEALGFKIVGARKIQNRRSSQPNQPVYLHVLTLQKDGQTFTVTNGTVINLRPGEGENHHIDTVENKDMPPQATSVAPTDP